MIKRRKKNKIAKPLLLITSIVLLNLTGISYASWQDDQQIFTEIKTAKMGPAFCDNFYLDAPQPNRDNGDLSVTLEDRQTINIQGTVDPRYKAFLHYCVNNDGTIPIKFDDALFEVTTGSDPTGFDFKVIGNEEAVKSKKRNRENLNNSNEGLKLQLNQQAGILDPSEVFFSQTGNPKLHIQADEPGTYDFEINLLFKQWTD